MSTQSAGAPEPAAAPPPGGSAANDEPVVIVGAGLAGLACARRLGAAGVPVMVLEAADGPGGRVRSDVIDGFTTDRGFQLLNPSYPGARRVLDLVSLRLQSFPAALVVAHGSSVLTVADPLREPGLIPATAASVLRGQLGTPLELARFARWALTAGRGDVQRIFAGGDLTWGEALDRLGVRGSLRRRVVEPFLAGVVGEDSGATSHQFVQLLVRSFVRGRPAVPWRGMQAIPDQLAAGVDVRLNTPVTQVRPGTVTTADGDQPARAVVVATDPVSASRLLGDRLGQPTPVMRPLTTFWHVADEPPTASAALHVDGDRRGPVINSVVISNAARGYSPDGRALIASTVLGAAGPGAAGSSAVERAVRTQLSLLYRTSAQGWQLLTTSEIPHALTASPPVLDPRQPVDLGDGRFVAGDHRDTSSIQGALVSGRRAAGAVLARLGRPELAPAKPGVP